MRFGGRPVERCDRHAHQASRCVSDAIASGDVGEQRLMRVALGDGMQIALI